MILRACYSSWLHETHGRTGVFIQSVMEAIFRNLEKGPYGCIRKVGPRRSEAFSILKRRCTLAMSPRFDNTRASSRVAIMRRVFTRNRDRPRAGATTGKTRGATQEDH